MGLYARPETLEQALDVLDGGAVTILAGGTDFYPARVGRSIEEDILDITALRALRTIDESEKSTRIGALVTWRDLIDRPLPPAFDGLKLAAREIGGRQIQNTATLCGNLCNASPAADGVPNLLVLEAEVELTSRRGPRRLPLADFVLGNRTTARAPDELMTAILVPTPPSGARSSFLKLGARKYLVISIVMTASLIACDEQGRVADARLSVGACSAKALRLPEAEAALLGHPLGPELAACLEPAHLAALAPLDDVRGTAAYRQEAALTLLRRGLLELAEAAA